MNEVKRVAIYARVSTKDKKQDVDNQLAQLREFCDRQSFEVAGEYIDHESGKRGRRERSAFARLFEDAGKRTFDLVLFWSLDRFSREGIRKTILYLQQLDGFGVRFKSYTEPYLDTDNELVSHILVATLSYFAAYEGRRISERTKAALARKKAQGVKLGQPSKFERHRDELAPTATYEVCFIHANPRINAIPRYCHTKRRTWRGLCQNHTS